jgi:16S rRNA (cytosine967-C5)-methyltransferase
MGRNDRLVLGTAVYGLARNRETLRAALPDAVQGAGELLALALLDALGERFEAVPGLAGEPDRWNRALDALAAERARCAEVLEASAGDPIGGTSRQTRSALQTLFSIPDWWLDSGPWQTVGDALQELGRLKAPQHLCLRVQPHRRSREAVLNELRTLGIPARPTSRSPWGIVVEGRHNVLATELYRTGLVEVQDEGSQLVACLCDPRPNEKILDLCAGAGGKSLALGAALKGRGAIVAHDRDTTRLLQTKKRARRAGLGNIRTVADPAEVEHMGPYDLVLVDAPCSSSGTLRRNPDVAWRWSPERIGRLAGVQAELLDWASTLVAPRATLIYVTCSLLTPENGAQIEPFLGRHPEFSLYPPGDRRNHGPLLSLPGSESGAFRLAANLADYDGDAFFLARFQRNR